MKRSSETVAAGFHFLPVCQKSLMQVSAGLETGLASGVAHVVSKYVGNALEDMMAATGGEEVVTVRYDDLFVLAMLLDMAAALRKADGGC
ncbi:hypothetical protein ACWKWK_15600 [Pseudoxanthomonas beigongshangi]